jgi:hypothetical protein
VVEIVIADLPPAIALTKTVSPTSVMEPGGSVRYKAEVTNNSNPGDPLTLTGLVDTLYGNLLDGGNDAITENNCMPNSVIQPSETYSCTFEAEVSGSAGQEVSDTITATAVDDEDNVAQANDDAAVIITAAPEPAISVVKTADPASVVEPGGPVLYTVQVTNDTNDVPVILTSLTDDPHGDLIGKDTANISASTCEQADIQPGISYQCTFEAEVSGSEGQVVSDTVTALARASSGKEATGYASAAVTITAKGLPHILVTKTAHPLYVYAPRGTVTYRVKVTNDSDDVPVTLASLDDDPYGDLTDDLNNPEISNSTCDLSAPEAIAIEPGNSYECAFRAEVEGVAGETVTDTVTAVALDPSGNQAEGTAIATVTIVTVPPDTGVALPAPVISGSLAVLGTALLTAGAFLRRQRLRAD